MGEGYVLLSVGGKDVVKSRTDVGEFSFLFLSSNFSRVEIVSIEAGEGGGIEDGFSVGFKEG